MLSAATAHTGRGGAVLFSTRSTTRLRQQSNALLRLPWSSRCYLQSFGVNPRAVRSSSKVIVWNRSVSGTASRHASDTNMYANSTNKTFRVAIVGSGPSGFYSAKYLLDSQASKRLKESNAQIEVDMFDRLPTPFGLVRYGVAPDHPEVKSVMETFTEVASSPKFRYFGNVEVAHDSALSDSIRSVLEVEKETVGHEISEGDLSGDKGEDTDAALRVSVFDLMQQYSAVVLAYGAAAERSLDIPGIDLPGVVSARDFVNWYNGHPDQAHLASQIEMDRVQHAVILGQGNVALDCARILGKAFSTSKTAAAAAAPAQKEIDSSGIGLSGDLPEDQLDSTDICSPALESMQANRNQFKTRTISVIGRRGHVQSAFTIKEFRELTRLKGVKLLISQSEVNAGLTEASDSEKKDTRAKKRLSDLIESVAKSGESIVGNKTADDEEKEEAVASGAEIQQQTQRTQVLTARNNDAGLDVSGNEVKISVRYLLNPVEVLGSDRTVSTHTSGKFRDGRMQQRVRAVVCQRTHLVGEAHAQRALPLDGQKPVILPCDLLLLSVGYRSLPLSPKIPFDFERHTVPHRAGRVVISSVALKSLESGDKDEQSALHLAPFSYDSIAPHGLCTSKMYKLPIHCRSFAAKGSAKEAESAPVGVVEEVSGLYVAGWLKRGPSGIIGSNIGDAKETVASILDDLQTGVLKPIDKDAGLESSELRNILLDLVATSSHESNVPTSSQQKEKPQQGEESTMEERVSDVASFEADKKGKKQQQQKKEKKVVVVVDWKGHERIDSEERRRGEERDPPKPREKIVSIAEMCRVATDRS